MIGHSSLRIQSMSLLYVKIHYFETNKSYQIELSRRIVRCEAKPFDKGSVYCGNRLIGVTSGEIPGLRTFCFVCFPTFWRRTIWKMTVLWCTSDPESQDPVWGRGNSNTWIAAVGHKTNNVGQFTLSIMRNCADKYPREYGQSLGPVLLFNIRFLEI
jgi:hypothetical protein